MAKLLLSIFCSIFTLVEKIILAPITLRKMIYFIKKSSLFFSQYNFLAKTIFIQNLSMVQILNFCQHFNFVEKSSKSSHLSQNLIFFYQNFNFVQILNFFLAFQFCGRKFNFCQYLNLLPKLYFFSGFFKFLSKNFVEKISLLSKMV